MRSVDVLVVGAGSAGVAAAVAAARNGATTLLVDAGPAVGGELVSGIPLIGCLNLRNEWIVGGVVRELLAECDAMGGYIGPVSDYRTLNVVCFDPEIMKLAVVRLLARHRVETLLYTFFEGVERDASGQVTAVALRNKLGRSLVHAKVCIDCSGDGDLAVAAGAPWEAGDASNGAYQAMTVMFRMVGVDTPALLQGIAREPDSFGLADHPTFGLTRDQCVAALLHQGQPKCAVLASGPLLRSALARGDLYPVSAVAVAPVSVLRREVSINATRVANVDATDTAALSASLATLYEQVTQCARFLQTRVPGFSDAHFSGVAPRIGIRETRRIQGDYVLSGADVLGARQHADSIAQGGHEIDIHAAGTAHDRRIISSGGAYGIPYSTLLPRGLNNVLVAGRCLSSTREGQSSARVMGTCMAMGQAAGTAAAMATAAGQSDLRAVAVPELQQRLRQQGALL